MSQSWVESTNWTRGLEPGMVVDFRDPLANYKGLILSTHALTVRVKVMAAENESVLGREFEVNRADLVSVDF